MQELLSDFTSSIISVLVAATITALFIEVVSNAHRHTYYWYCLAFDPGDKSRTFSENVSEGDHPFKILQEMNSQYRASTGSDETVHCLVNWSEISKEDYEIFKNTHH